MPPPLPILIFSGFSGVYPSVYPSVLALCLVAWVIILHRRERVRAKQAEADTAFAKDRNEIIDSFGRDESIEAILNRICSMVEVYLPGSSCRIELIREGGVARDASPGGLPILSVTGNTVAIMRVAGHQDGAESKITLNEITRLTAQAIEQRRLYDRLLRQSPQYMLEGIVDRVLLDQRLEAALSRARVHGHEVAVIHMGLESFEDINELLGSAAADIVLHGAAFRLLSCTRPSDHVARISRDEFLVILTELHGRGNAEEVARRIVASLDAPMEVGSENISVGAAVGICVFPEQAADAGEMQRRAHLAMYSAKTAAESQYSFYEEEASESVGNAVPSDVPREASTERHSTQDLLVLNSVLPQTGMMTMQNGTEPNDYPLNLD